MDALINISSEEYPKIVKGTVLFKDDIHAGVNNYLVRLHGSDKIVSVERNKITNYDELLKHYGPKINEPNQK